MTKHTQEPWEITTANTKHDHYLDIGILADGWIICDMTADCFDTDIQEANAQRIVHCVNYCEGLTNEEMEGFKVARKLDDMNNHIEFAHLEIERLKSERDEAVKALKELDRIVSDVGSPSIHYLRKFITDTLTKIGGHNE